VFTLDGARARERIDPIIGQRRGCDGEIPGRDLDRALTEIEIEMIVERPVDHPRIECEVSNCAIAVPGFALRDVYRFVEGRLASEKALEHA